MILKYYPCKSIKNTPPDYFQNVKTFSESKYSAGDVWEIQELSSIWTVGLSEYQHDGTIGNNTVCEVFGRPGWHQ